MPAQITIVKSTSWRGNTEEFENVYHYDVAPSLMQDSDWSGLIDAIVSIEKSFHSSDVTWVRASANGPTEGTKEDNIMQYAKDLSGVGSISAGTIMPKEMTIVTQLYMGRSGAPFHRKTFLRKYWHVGTLSPAGSGSDALGNGPLSSAQKSFYAGKMDSLKNVTGNAVTYHLCKANGQGVPLATGAVCLNYAHTRQFRR